MQNEEIYKLTDEFSTTLFQKGYKVLLLQLVAYDPLLENNLDAYTFSTSQTFIDGLPKFLEENQNLVALYADEGKSEIDKNRYLSKVYPFENPQTLSGNSNSLRFKFLSSYAPNPPENNIPTYKKTWSKWISFLEEHFSNAGQLHIIGSHTKSTNSEYISGVYILLSKESKMPESNEKLHIINPSKALISLVKNKQFDSLTASIKKATLQAAVAQIFARNFAHNIGSHVAIRATNEAIKERIIELHHKDKTTRQKKRGVFKDDTITDWLDYASGVLDMYEVVKNEFLAEYKLPPKNTSFYRNVILPFAENTLIMDNIAHSEQVSYDATGETNKLKIKVFYNNIELEAIYPNLYPNNKGQIEYPENFPYLLNVAKDEEEKENGLTIKDAINNKIIVGNDIEICLASEHSIYSILENFIRNSAKHNKEKLQTNENGLEICLKIDDTHDDPDYYDLYLYDNVSQVTAETLLKLQEGIDADLFESDGQLARNSLGIADMKINAPFFYTCQPTFKPVFPARFQ